MAEEKQESLQGGVDLDVGGWLKRISDAVGHQVQLRCRTCGHPKFDVCDKPIYSIIGHPGVETVRSMQTKMPVREFAVVRFSCQVCGTVMDVNVEHLVDIGKLVEERKERGPKILAPSGQAIAEAKRTKRH